MRNWDEMSTVGSLEPEPASHITPLPGLRPNFMLNGCLTAIIYITSTQNYPECYAYNAI